MGQYGQGYGNVYNLMSDYYNEIPIAGFFSGPYFDQYAYYNVAYAWDTDYKTRIESFSNTGHNFVYLRTNISDNAASVDDLYPGIFADWDVGNYSLNRGGYDPSRNLLFVYENGGGIDSSYYGIMGISINGVSMAENTMKGIITHDLVWNRTDLYNFMTSTAFTPITTDADYRMFISVGPFSIPVGSTLAIDFAIVVGTSLADLLANADEAINYGVNVPVELTTFTATSLSGKVILNWATATEINNLGFEIERRIINYEKQGEWITVGFEEGNGTTTEQKEYAYVDDIRNLTAASLKYRLKQIDFDGSFEYSDVVLVDYPAPVAYALHQNYPNPFNPKTSIKYGVPIKANVVLKVYSAIGSEVVTLVNEEKPAGNYEVAWNAENIPSGVYFYKMQAGSFIETRKMILIK